jgi:hypothetical protein
MNCSHTEMNFHRLLDLFQQQEGLKVDLISTTTKTQNIERYSETYRLVNMVLGNQLIHQC